MHIVTSIAYTPPYLPLSPAHYSAAKKLTHSPQAFCTYQRASFESLEDGKRCGMLRSLSEEEADLGHRMSLVNAAQTVGSRDEQEAGRRTSDRERKYTKFGSASRTRIPAHESGITRPRLLRTFSCPESSTPGSEYETCSVMMERGRREMGQVVGEIRQWVRGMWQSRREWESAGREKPPGQDGKLLLQICFQKGLKACQDDWQGKEGCESVGVEQEGPGTERQSGAEGCDAEAGHMDEGAVGGVSPDSPLGDDVQFALADQDEEMEEELPIGMHIPMTNFGLTGPELLLLF